VAPWLVKRTVNPAVHHDSIGVDTGIVQIDSLSLDASASIRRAEGFMTTFDSRLDGEVDFLRRHDVVMTVSDMPALGIAAGYLSQVPSIALGNFTWDWIYEHYRGGQQVADVIGNVYSHATVALRLPMWGGFATMRKIQDLPFVARRSTRDPIEVREALGIPLDVRVVLASFGGYGLEGLNAEALRGVRGYHVLLPGMIDETAMYANGYRYEDLVRAVDVVATKPGYGIISECLANDTALLYTSRGDFREYQVLVDAMPKFLRCAFIDHADLFAGRWGGHLDGLLEQPEPPEKPATNGADVAADILSKLIP
jgi:L-arabinokinase